MAAPTKARLEYYARDIGLERDRKFRRPRLQHGAVVVLVYELLLDLIYGDQGYFLYYGSTDQKEDVHWAIQTGLQGKDQPAVDKISKMVASLIDSGLFEPRLAEQGVLTSHRIQRTYYRATVERREVQIQPAYWLLSPEEMQLLSRKSAILRQFDRGENGVYGANNGEDPPREAQSKEKDSTRSGGGPRALDIYVEDVLDTDEGQQLRPDYPQLFGGIGQHRVLLTDAQIDSLMIQIGHEAFDYYVEKLADYIGHKGRFVKDHYRTILKWAREDGKV
ncbi:Lin1244/Lin1753 domain-containing protein [Neobittarella massiliensis]|uniref:Lin1244/Lin1753 domain-containing protein n=1 Tax=Neobittarella massiliensis (ex Bilen et al. 2018) TaxID=2041842 RepID=UPI0013EE14ED|nr:Lin1244/Lin1753 domain-containing protein [Neobittarella massiliensis]